MRYKKKQESVQEYDQIVKTVCQECLVGCGLKFFKQYNQVVDIAGDEDHPINKGSVCPRGAKIVQNLYNNGDMLAQYPVVKKGLNDTDRRISWDEGIDYVADRLEEIRREYGKDALTVLISNPNNFTNNYLGLRFAKIFGTNNAAVYDPMKPASELAQHVLGGVKGALCNPPHDWINSKVILVLGSEISSEVMLMGYLLDAKERGTKIICVDSKYSPVMAKANYPIIIKPGTFDAFMLGIINTIISEEVYEAKTIKRWANGLGEIVRACLPYKQSDIAAKCGLAPETIASLAQLLAEDHPIQVLGSIRDDQVNGTDDLVRLAWMSIVLLTLSNSLGVKGGGWNWLGTGSLPFTFGQDMEDIQGSQGEQDFNHLLKEIIEKETCKALIWDGNISDESMSKEFILALSKLKLVVHLSDKNDAAKKYAHVSFPVTNWLEEEGPVFCSHYRSIQWNNKVTEAFGERKPAGMFWLKLADKMGYQKWFPWGEKDTEPDFVLIANQHIKETGVLACLSALDSEVLNPGGIMWPCINEENALFEDRALIKGSWLLYKYEDKYPGTNQSFPTVSGKVELMSKACKDIGLGQQPFGAINSEPQTASSYGYSLVACSALSFLGYTGSVFNSKYVVGINPADADAFGIKDGDMIVLEKETKETFEGPAWVTNKIIKNTIGMIDSEEPSYYAKFSYRGGWIEGTPIRILKK
ncbi:MAG: molybdopterin-dependent oxidoreductase [Dehalobacterium sp.]